MNRLKDGKKIRVNILWKREERLKFWVGFLVLVWGWRGDKNRVEGVLVLELIK